MKISVLVAGSALLVIGLAGCKPAPEPPPTAPPTVDAAAAPAASTVFEVMTQQFAPESNTLWDLAGKLYAPNGDLDARQLNDQQWQEITANATKMRDMAAHLAELPKVTVAPEGVKLLNEGTGNAFNAAQVQATIDANPAGFQEEARKLAAVSADFIAAAAAKDATKADDASNRLNEVCTACHTAYWYPNQPG